MVCYSHLLLAVFPELRTVCEHAAMFGVWLDRSIWLDRVLNNNRISNKQHKLTEMQIMQTCTRNKTDGHLISCHFAVVLPGDGSLPLLPGFSGTGHSCARTPPQVFQGDPGRFGKLEENSLFCDVTRFRRHLRMDSLLEHP